MRTKRTTGVQFQTKAWGVWVATLSCTSPKLPPHKGGFQERTFACTMQIKQPDLALKYSKESKTGVPVAQNMPVSAKNIF